MDKSIINDFLIKIEPEKEIALESFQINSNSFLFLWNKQLMLSALELDMIADKVKAPKLPDMFYGYNRFYILFPKENCLIYEINPIQLLDYSTYELRNKVYISPEDKESKDLNESNVNCIYYLPKEIKLQFHEKWKNLKVPENTEIQTQESTADWFYSTSFMGSFTKYTDHSIYHQHLEEPYKKLFSYNEEELKSMKFQIRRELTTEDIPVEKLMPDNPVLQYWDLPIFDDELNDNGLSTCNFRFRVMKDCFFGLLRHYLRVDNVVVRVIDTRIFHLFGANYILRDFQVRENSYEELKKKGFVINSEWSLNHSQSDIVYQYLSTVLHIKDKIIFSN